MKNDQPTNAERGEPSDELDPRCIAEADALEAMLASRHSSADESSRIEGTEGEGAAELASLIGRVRSAYGAGEAPEGSADAFQAKRVAQRVLEKTTREDFRRRADLGVILSFAGDRLRDSAVLRVAAALLIVQLTLVPLVAWQMWRTPHSGIFHTGIEPSAEELAQALEDLPSDELMGDIGDDTTTLGTRLDQEALEEGAAEAAAVLNGVLSQLPGNLRPTTSAGRALAVMTRLAVRERCSATDTELVNALAQPIGPFESIVVAEARLYLLACGGGWDGLLEALDHLAVISGDESDDPSSSVGPMAARAVRRAAIMGVANSDRGESLIGAVGDRWQRGGAEWLIVLGRSLQAEAPGDPYVAEWIASIVQDS